MPPYAGAGAVSTRVRSTVDHLSPAAGALLLHGSIVTPEEASEGAALAPRTGTAALSTRAEQR